MSDKLKHSDIIDFEYKKLESAQEMINKADNKGAILLAILGAFLAFSDQILILPFKMIDYGKLDWWWIVGISVLLTIYVLVILRCIWSIKNVLVARVQGIVKNQEDIINSNESAMFSGGIVNDSENNPKKYSEYFDGLEITEKKQLKDISSQVFINSKIAMLKFQNFNKALKCLIPIIALFAILMIISYLIPEAPQVCEVIIPQG